MKKLELDYRQIYESTLEAIFIHDAETGTILDINQTMVEMFGFLSKEEFLTGDQAVLSSGGPGYTTVEAYQKLEEARQKGQIMFEWPARRKSGDLFWTEVSLRYVKSQNIIIAMVRDISKRKKIEIQKSLTEEKLHLLITHARDPVFVKDRSGKYVIVSEAMANILGKPTQEIVGKKHEELFGDGRINKIRNWDQKVLKGESVYYSDQLTINEKIQYIQVTKLPIKDTDGSVKGILGMVFDVTEQHKTINQLKDTSARLLTIIREAPIGIVLSRDGIYLDANPAYLKMFQLASAEELKGKPIYNQLAPSERERVKEMVESRKEGKSVSTEYETMGIRADGTTFPFYVNVKRLELEEGPITIAFFLDLSDKKESEKKEALLKRAIDQSYEGIAIADLQGTIIYANPRWAQMHEWLMEEILGKNLAIFHTEKQLQEEVLPFNKVVFTNGSNRGEIGHVTASGHEFPTYMLTTLLKDETGKPYALLGTARDITQEKAIEKDLKKSKKNLEIAQKIGKTGFIEWNLKKNKLFLSPQVCKIFGLPEGAEWFPGSFIKRMVHPDDYEAVSSGLQAAIKNKKKYDLVHRIVRPDETIVWVHAQAEIIRDEANNPEVLLGYVQDITLNKQAELEQEKLRAELFQAQKMESIGRLAGGVAHDFNNMLSVILGYGEMLMREMDQDHPFYKKISSIYDAGNRARNLTRQLLAFSRKQAMKMTIVSINDVIESFVKLIKSLLPEDVQLICHFPDKPLSVKVDQSQMEQVLLNLAVNAKDAMPRGGTISIRMEKILLDKEFQKLPPGEYAIIRVSDSGQGMSEEVCRQIFEPFFTTKKQGKGTGLGLSTCFGIVAQHNGTIRVRSKIGMGTTFEIYLPLVEEENSNQEGENKAVSTHLQGSGTILLVEDETEVRNLAKLVLQENGYRVLEARNADMAIRLVNENEPIDLLLTDIVMPDMKGPQLYARIKKMNPQIKVLYMSGYSEEMIDGRGLSIEKALFVQKPFSITGLLNKIYRTLHGEVSG